MWVMRRIVAGLFFLLMFLPTVAMGPQPSPSTDPEGVRLYAPQFRGGSAVFRIVQPTTKLTNGKVFRAPLPRVIINYQHVLQQFTLTIPVQNEPDLAQEIHIIELTKKQLRTSDPTDPVPQGIRSFLSMTGYTRMAFVFKGVPTPSYPDLKPSLLVVLDGNPDTDGWLILIITWRVKAVAEVKMLETVEAVTP